MTGRLSPEDIDRVTAPEYARMYAIELDLTDEATEKAVKMADEHGLNASTSRQPQSVAAGAVYFAALLSNEKATQAEVSEVAGVSALTIRNAYQEIVEAEGFLSEYDAQLSDDEQDSLLERVYDRVQARLGGGGA